MALEKQVGLEHRLWVAQKLRPASGLEDYIYGLDADFCDRVDSGWALLYHLLNRPSLAENPVRVVNL